MWQFKTKPCVIVMGNKAIQILVPPLNKIDMEQS